MPQLSQQSPLPTTLASTANTMMMATTTTIPNNRTTTTTTISPVYLDIENSRTIMNETNGRSPTGQTMVQFDNYDVLDDDDDDRIIRSAKGQLIDFNLFYENLLANHNHNHNHHHDVYALNSATFFNESLNFCLNKVCNGKNHHHHNHHNNHNHHQTMSNNENNNNSNKSFSIDSILGFAAAAAVARKDITKDTIINDDVVLYGHQTSKLHSIPGNQSILYPNHHHHHHHHHQTATTMISAKKLSNEEQQHQQQHHHHHHHHPNHNCLKQNDPKLKGCKKIATNKKCLKATGNDDKNFVHTNIGSKSKRVRTIFTPEQLERLENEFEKQQYMVGTGRLYLASTLNLTEAQVKVWFQNRRIKWRKQHLEGYQDNPDTIKDNKKMVEEHVDHTKQIMAT